jgi:ABC-type antimicrobial peptide transport system permease subunit
MFLARSLVLASVGAAVGLGGAIALTRLMESQLFGVTAFDPGTYAVGATVLVATAIVASYLPVRRLTRVDPMDALRTE